MLRGEIHHEVFPLPRDEEHVNPHEIVEDPPRCRGLHSFALLIGERRIVGFERLTDAVFQGGIDQ